MLFLKKPVFELSLLWLDYSLTILLYSLEWIQGDRTEKVGVIDSEYIVHKGIPSLGGASTKMVLDN